MFEQGGLPELLKQGASEMYHNPIVNTAISLTPGAGDVQSGYEAVQSAKEGNWGEAGLNRITSYNVCYTKLLRKAKERRSRVCAVGTTVIRTLESSVSTSGMVKPFNGWTNKFIFPPYEFKVPDMLVSNFHSYNFV